MVINIDEVNVYQYNNANNITSLINTKMTWPKPPSEHLNLD
jgi:hypothetical protein